MQEISRNLNHRNETAKKQTGDADECQAVVATGIRGRQGVGDSNRD